MENGIKNQSIYKAFQVLECFTKEKVELSIQELSMDTGLYKSNVFNILSTLKSLGYVHQNADNHKYYLSSKFAVLASNSDAGSNLWKRIPETLQKIAQATGEVAFFAIRGGDEIKYLNSAYPNGREPSSALNMTGMSAPMYCTSLGKVILAWQDRENVLAYLSREELVPFTDNTITDHDAFLAELETVRQQGYAIDNMEHEYGIICLAVPVFVEPGKLLGAISVSGPSLRFSISNITRILDVLRKHVLDMEAQA